MQKTESGKDEIEALKDQVSALEKQLKEVHEEDSEKSERDQVVGAAEKKNEELLQKLAKFEKDMAVGAQVCDTPSLSNCKIQLCTVCR